MGGQKRSEDDVKKMIQMYENGSSTIDIANAFNLVGSSNVGRILKRNGVVMRTPARKSKISDSQIERYKQLYNEGYTLAEIGRKFDNQSPQQIKNHFDRVGFDCSRGHNRLDLKKQRDFDKQICTAYGMGLNQAQVAEKFGITPDTVKRILVRNNVSIKGRAAIVKSQKDFETKQMYEFYQQGYTLKQTGEQFGITMHSVVDRFKARNLPRRKKGEKVPVNKLQIRIAPKNENRWI